MLRTSTIPLLAACSVDDECMSSSWTLVVEGDFVRHAWLDAETDFASVVSARVASLGIDPGTRTSSVVGATVRDDEQPTWIVTEAWVRSGPGTICTLAVEVSERAGSLAFACSILVEALRRLGDARIDAVTVRCGEERPRDGNAASDALWTELSAPADATSALVAAPGAGPGGPPDDQWASASDGVSWLRGSRWRTTTGVEPGAGGRGLEMQIVVPEWSSSVVALVADTALRALGTREVRVARH